MKNLYTEEQKGLTEEEWFYEENFVFTQILGELAQYHNSTLKSQGDKNDKIEAKLKELEKSYIESLNKKTPSPKSETFYEPVKSPPRPITKVSQSRNNHTD